MPTLPLFSILNVTVPEVFTVLSAESALEEDVPYITSLALDEVVPMPTVEDPM
jgi:hypothetical protein